MPSSLYTCKTLTHLSLSGKVHVDVPLSVSLPSLTQLSLLSVVYKDQDSHVKLLSSCPNLKNLKVRRLNDDNVRKFSVKVASLLVLRYEDMRFHDNDIDVSLVIDTPSLVYLKILDTSVQSNSIECMPHLVQALIFVAFNPNANFLRSLSLVKCMTLAPFSKMDPSFNAVNYSQLEECCIELFDSQVLESILVFLSNCPKLKALTVLSEFEIEYVPLLWNQPSSVPKCLSSHLEIFECEGYKGRECEKDLMRYILGNSKCLKTVKILPKSRFNLEEEHKFKEELESMFWSSTLSQMLFRCY